MRILALAAALAAATPAALHAQEIPPAPPIGAPKPFALPATETFTLPNGMAVTLVPYGVAPKATVQLRVYAGNLNEGKDTWLTDLTAAMLGQGAAGKSASQLATTAAAMGGDLNVGNNPIQTFITMNVLSEFAPDAVGLVADVAQRPDFPAGELDREKANMSRRLAVALSQAGSQANVALARAYYGTDHPFGRPMPTPAQFAAYTLDQVKAFHAANFGAKRARLYIAGRFDAAAVKAAITKAFSGWAAGPDRLSLPPSPKAGPQLLLVDRPKAVQSTIRIAFPAPAAGSAGDIPLRVSNALLGGSFSSRITKNIREAKGYTYSPGSGIQFNPSGAIWVFQADVTSAHTGDSLKEVFGEIRRLQGEAPSAEEATGMRSYMAGVFVIQNSTAPALVGTLGTRDMLGLPANWLDQYVPSVLAVTPEQFSSSVKSALPLDKATVVVVGDLATVTPQLQALPELQGVTPQTVTVP